MRFPAALALTALLGACALDFDRFDQRSGDAAVVDAAAEVPADGAADVSLDATNADFIDAVDVIDGAVDVAAPVEAGAADAAPADAAAPIDAAPIDAGCTPSPSCFTTLRSCTSDCASTHTQCIAACSTCGNLCAAAEQICLSNCSQTCTSCTQRAGCRAASACADGG